MMRGIAWPWWPQTRRRSPDPLNRAARYAFAPKYMYYQWKGQAYMPDREPIMLKYLAQQVKGQLDSAKADCIFAPNSCVTSHLNTDLPVVFCTDATFDNMLDFYGEFSNCPQSYREMGHEQERRALLGQRRASLEHLSEVRGAADIAQQDRTDEGPVADHQLLVDPAAGLRVLHYLVFGVLLAGWGALQPWSG